MCSEAPLSPVLRAGRRAEGLPEKHVKSCVCGATTGASIHEDALRDPRVYSALVVGDVGCAGVGLQGLRGPMASQIVLNVCLSLRYGNDVTRHRVCVHVLRAVGKGQTDSGKDTHTHTHTHTGEAGRF